MIFVLGKKFDLIRKSSVLNLKADVQRNWLQTIINTVKLKILECRNPRHKHENQSIR